ncbi:uncharacterized protein N7477_002411 [Penicillium maclennaniae]|uniref:uncharacterized protein n=1 Tax=Penicillium maclennaniae TaxID=1343394 RepID=UPI002541ED4E|nr:uncharacterized protein N7477_002411 [Penicillium maclennaniae]KAJ5676778.1 hypothetical protein N7477_002411 [Penicillium maclennaniae]
MAENSHVIISYTLEQEGARLSFLIVTGNISAIRSNFRAQSVVGGAPRERPTLVRGERLHGPFTVDLRLDQGS